MSDVGNLARRARRAAGDPSQRAFAKMIGATSAAISRWETGDLNPSGISRSLLLIIEKHPKLVERVLKRAATDAKGGSK